MKTRNPVCRYAHKFNKAATFTDRKRNSKNGYAKHKKSFKLALDN